MKNSILYPTRFLGLTHSSPQVEVEKKFITNDIAPLEESLRVGVQLVSGIEMYE